MVVPFMTLYLTTELGFSVGEAGLVFGLFGIGSFSGAWIGGKLTDKIGFFPIQLFTLTGGALLFVLLGQMKTYPLISLFTFLLSFVNESFRPANSTAIAFYSKEDNRTRSYALNRLAINLGWAIGSAIGGILAHINYELLFWVDGCTNFSAALLLWLFMKPEKIITRTPNHRHNTSLSPYRDKQYMLFIAATALFASCFFQLFTNLPVFFKKNVLLSELSIGFIMAANGILIALFEMVTIYKLEGRRKNTTYITAGVILAACAFMTLNLPAIGPVLSFLMICLMTWGEILCIPFMNSYWISRSQPSNTGQYAALYTMAWAAAQSLGPAGGAWLAQQTSFSILWWATAATCLLAAFFFSRLKNKPRG